MNAKLKIFAVGLLCLNVGGCDLIDGILDPDNGDDDAKIDKTFKSEALQLGLSESNINRLCTATSKIKVHCVSTLNENTNQQEVRVEYTFNNVLLKNDYAKSTNASRIIFHLPADSATASFEFENSRTYEFNSGYEYTTSEPTDFDTANLANSSLESIAKLVNTSVTDPVSDSELSIISTASLSNTDYARTEAQDIILAASTMLFPPLTVEVTSNSITEPVDASFAMFTAGHTAILSNYRVVFLSSIEQTWN
ncbi:hypothetical protein [Shewanella donghaensis]|uniref:hypothetical protein n=1 Tax=Shewanella donghaensis TaxID=238836 RepID=UPI001182315A|nr:hypothetical protein [Shewanella donghaensis]